MLWYDDKMCLDTTLSHSTASVAVRRWSSGRVSYETSRPMLLHILYTTAAAIKLYSIVHGNKYGDAIHDKVLVGVHDIVCIESSNTTAHKPITPCCLIAV